MKPSQFVLEPIPFKGCDFDTWEVRPYDVCPCEEHEQQRRDAAVKSWKVEVIADRTGTWSSNGLRFATKADALDWGECLFMRWTAVREWRVTATDEEPSHMSYTDSKGHTMAVKL